MQAMDKQSVKIDAFVGCPNCEARSEIRFSRKYGNLKLECSDCGIVHDETVWYGVGAVVGGVEE